MHDTLWLPAGRVAQALKEGREPDLSDYKEFKLTCENVGFQMLSRMGWEEGAGLGSRSSGILNPVDKCAPLISPCLFIFLSLHQSD